MARSQLTNDGMNRLENPSRAKSNSINAGGFANAWFRGVKIDTSAFTLEHNNEYY